MQGENFYTSAQHMFRLVASIFEFLRVRRGRASTNSRRINWVTWGKKLVRPVPSFPILFLSLCPRALCKHCYPLTELASPVLHSSRRNKLIPGRSKHGRSLRMVEERREKRKRLNDREQERERESASPETVEDETRQI